jgi:hypothetical protein
MPYNPLNMALEAGGNLELVATAVRGPVFTTGIVSKDNNESLEIRPAAGCEVVITLVAFQYAMELYLTDGTNPVKILSSDAADENYSVLGIPITNSLYLTLKNVSGGAASLLCAIGHYTTEA